MKNHIAIFGLSSYIGTHFAEFYAKDSSSDIEFIQSRDEKWKSMDFSVFDVILFVAGIAHVSHDPKMESLYYSVNRDLPIEVAKKSKEEGVKQFIFLSSMIVYGHDISLGNTFLITKDTEPNPENFYGKSKLEAEDGISQLQDERFIVSVLRLPMVYGPGCKGNFPQLIKLGRTVPIFPDIENKRSMIYIENLCEYIKLCIVNRFSGICFPQNADYISTKEIVLYVAENNNHHIICTKFFNPLIFLLSRHWNTLNKVFGTKIYDKALSSNVLDYNKVSFTDSMDRCLLYVKG